MTKSIEDTATLGATCSPAAAAMHANDPALRTARGTVAWTWLEYADRVRAAAAGCTPSTYGVGDTVALWLANRPELHVADAAAMQLGAVPFAVYSTSTIGQAEHVVGDAGSRVLVTEPAYLRRAPEIRERGRTALELIVLVDGADTKAPTWEELLAAASGLRRRSGRG